MLKCLFGYHNPSEWIPMFGWWTRCCKKCSKTQNGTYVIEEGIVPITNYK